MKHGAPWLVLALALAGCGGSPATDEAGSADAAPPGAPVPVPAWALGDWWTYTLGGQSVTWVVTEDAGTAWILDVDSPDTAFQHAAFAQISTVGSVSKDHLSGSQEAGPVKFFDFPLVENKTWSMTWDGIEFQATVVDVSEDTAEVQARAADGSVRVYVYDGGDRWFSTIAAYDANETELWKADLQAKGRAYAGPFYRWDIHDQVEVHVRPGQQDIKTFDVPDGATDIWYFVHIICLPDGLEQDQGAYIFEVHPEDSQQGLSATGVCPTPFVRGGTMPGTAGEWGITAVSAGGQIDVLLIPRTLRELRL